MRIRWGGHPLAYVTTRWLARAMNVPLHRVQDAKVRHGARTVLDRWDIHHFGEPSTFQEWIAAWGGERVRAYAAQLSAEARAQVEAALEPGVSRASDRARLEAESQRRREAKKRVAAPRTPPDLSAHPLGLIPDGVIDTVAGVSHDTALRARRRLGIAASTVRRVPFGDSPRHWYVWVDAWGLDRVTAYVTAHLPHLREKFVHAMATRGQPRRRVRKPKTRSARVVPPLPPALPRRPSPVPSRDREAPASRLTREQEEQAVREFLARKQAQRALETT